MNNLKLITTHPNYLLLVDTDSAIKIGDYVVHGNYMMKEGWNWGINRVENEADCKHYKEMQELMREGAVKSKTDKLHTVITEAITAHLPLNDAPVLEGVMLMVDLPGFDKKEEMRAIRDVAKQLGEAGEIDDKHWPNLSAGFHYAFYKGYKAASKRYSEEDIDAAFLAGSNHQDQIHELKFLAEDYSSALDRFKGSLSPVPVLPVDFEPEYENKKGEYMNDPDLLKTEGSLLGKRIVQGRWIY